MTKDTRMRRGASFELKMGKNEDISRIFEPLKERESERAAKKDKSVQC